jgi:hypothetical protein
MQLSRFSRRHVTGERHPRRRGGPSRQPGRLADRRWAFMCGVSSPGFTVHKRALWRFLAWLFGLQEAQKFRGGVG